MVNFSPAAVSSSSSEKSAAAENRSFRAKTLPPNELLPQPGESVQKKRSTFLMKDRNFPPPKAGAKLQRSDAVVAETANLAINGAGISDVTKPMHTNGVVVNGVHSAKTNSASMKLEINGTTEVASTSSFNPLAHFSKSNGVARSLTPATDDSEEDMPLLLTRRKLTFNYVNSYEKKREATPPLPSNSVAIQNGLADAHHQIAGANVDHNSQTPTAMRSQTFADQLLNAAKQQKLKREKSRERSREDHAEITLEQIAGFSNGASSSIKSGASKEVLNDDTEAYLPEPQPVVPASALLEKVIPLTFQIRDKVAQLESKISSAAAKIAPTRSSRSRSREPQPETILQQPINNTTTPALETEKLVTPDPKRSLSSKPPVNRSQNADPPFEVEVALSASPRVTTTTSTRSSSAVPSVFSSSRVITTNVPSTAALTTTAAPTETNLNSGGRLSRRSYRQMPAETNIRSHSSRPDSATALIEPTQMTQTGNIRSNCAVKPPIIADVATTPAATVQTQKKLEDSSAPGDVTTKPAQAKPAMPMRRRNFSTPPEAPKAVASQCSVVHAETEANSFEARVSLDRNSRPALQRQTSSGQFLASDAASAKKSAVARKHSVGNSLSQLKLFQNAGDDFKPPVFSTVPSAAMVRKQSIENTQKPSTIPTQTEIALQNAKRPSQQVSCKTSANVESPAVNSSSTPASLPSPITPGQALTSPLLTAACKTDTETVPPVSPSALLSKKIIAPATSRPNVEGTPDGSISSPTASLKTSSIRPFKTAGREEMPKSEAGTDAANAVSQRNPAIVPHIALQPTNLQQQFIPDKKPQKPTSFAIATPLSHKPLKSPTTECEQAAGSSIASSKIPRSPTAQSPATLRNRNYAALNRTASVATPVAPDESKKLASPLTSRALSRKISSPSSPPKIDRQQSAPSPTLPLGIAGTSRTDKAAPKVTISKIGVERPMKKTSLDSAGNFPDDKHRLISRKTRSPSSPTPPSKPNGFKPPLVKQGRVAPSSSTESMTSTATNDSRGQKAKGKQKLLRDRQGNRLLKPPVSDASSLERPSKKGLKLSKSFTAADRPKALTTTIPTEDTISDLAPAASGSSTTRQMLNKNMKANSMPCAEPALPWNSPGLSFPTPNREGLFGIKIQVSAAATVSLPKKRPTTPIEEQPMVSVTLPLLKKTYPAFLKQIKSFERRQLSIEELSNAGPKKILPVPIPAKATAAAVAAKTTELQGEQPSTMSTKPKTAVEVPTNKISPPEPAIMQTVKDKQMKLRQPEPVISQPATPSWLQQVKEKAMAKAKQHIDSVAPLQQTPSDVFSLKSQSMPAAGAPDAIKSAEPHKAVARKTSAAKAKVESPEPKQSVTGLKSFDSKIEQPTPTSVERQRKTSKGLEQLKFNQRQPIKKVAGMSQPECQKRIMNGDARKSSQSKETIRMKSQEILETVTPQTEQKFLSPTEMLPRQDFQTVSPGSLATNDVTRATPVNVPSLVRDEVATKQIEESVRPPCGQKGYSSQLFLPQPTPDDSSIEQLMKAVEEDKRQQMSKRKLLEDQKVKLRKTSIPAPQSEQSPTKKLTATEQMIRDQRNKLNVAKAEKQRDAGQSAAPAFSAAMLRHVAPPTAVKAPLAIAEAMETDADILDTPLPATIETTQAVESKLNQIMRPSTLSLSEMRTAELPVVANAITSKQDASAKRKASPVISPKVPKSTPAGKKPTSPVTQEVSPQQTPPPKRNINLINRWGIKSRSSSTTTPEPPTSPPISPSTPPLSLQKSPSLDHQKLTSLMTRRDRTRLAETKRRSTESEEADDVKKSKANDAKTNASTTNQKLPPRAPPKLPRSDVSEGPQPSAAKPFLKKTIRKEKQANNKENCPLMVSRSLNNLLRLKPVCKSESNLCIPAAVENGIKPEFWAKPKSIKATEGGFITMECRLLAYPEPKLSVYLNNDHFGQSERVQCCVIRNIRVYTFYFIIDGVTAAEAGTLTFVATNELGTAACSIEMIVDPAVEGVESVQEITMA